MYGQNPQKQHHPKFQLPLTQLAGASKMKQNGTFTQLNNQFIASKSKSSLIQPSWQKQRTMGDYPTTSTKYPGIFNANNKRMSQNDIKKSQTEAQNHYYILTNNNHQPDSFQRMEQQSTKKSQQTQYNQRPFSSNFATRSASSRTFTNMRQKNPFQNKTLSRPATSNFPKKNMKSYEQLQQENNRIKDLTKQMYKTRYSSGVFKNFIDQQKQQLQQQQIFSPDLQYNCKIGGSYSPIGLQTSQSRDFHSKLEFTYFNQFGVSTPQNDAKININYDSKSMEQAQKARKAYCKSHTVDQEQQNMSNNENTFQNVPSQNQFQRKSQSHTRIGSSMKKSRSNLQASNTGTTTTKTTKTTAKNNNEMNKKKPTQQQNTQSKKVLFKGGNMNYSLGRSKQNRGGLLGGGGGGVKGYNYYYNANFQKNFQNHKYESFTKKDSELKSLCTKTKSAIQSVNSKWFYQQKWKDIKKQYSDSTDIWRVYEKKWVDFQNKIQNRDATTTTTTTTTTSKQVQQKTLKLQDLPWPPQYNLLFYHTAVQMQLREDNQDEQEKKLNVQNKINFDKKKLKKIHKFALMRYHPDRMPQLVKGMVESERKQVEDRVNSISQILNNDFNVANV